MATKTLKPANLYDQDFATWTSETARLLRARRFDEIDIEHVAEEIEDMGKSEMRELLSRLSVIILHLLKWNLQADRRTPGWKSTIIVQRAELGRLFEQSPSLTRSIEAAIVKVYPATRDAAAAETGLAVGAFPPDCPFSPEQILSPTFFPE